MHYHFHLCIRPSWPVMVLQRKLHFWNFEHFVPFCSVHTFSSGILILIAYYMILSTLLTIILQIHLLQQRNEKKAHTQMKHEHCYIKKKEPKMFIIRPCCKTKTKVIHLCLKFCSVIYGSG